MKGCSTCLLNHDMGVSRHAIRPPGMDGLKAGGSGERACDTTMRRRAAKASLGAVAKLWDSSSLGERQERSGWAARSKLRLANGESGRRLLRRAGTLPTRSPPETTSPRTAWPRTALRLSVTSRRGTSLQGCCVVSNSSSIGDLVQPGAVVSDHVVVDLGELAGDGSAGQAQQIDAKAGEQAAVAAVGLQPVAGVAVAAQPWRWDARNQVPAGDHAIVGRVHLAVEGARADAGRAEGVAGGQGVAVEVGRRDLRQRAPQAVAGDVEPRSAGTWAAIADRMAGRSAR